jgi:hypothetical protein
MSFFAIRVERGRIPAPPFPRMVGETGKSILPEKSKTGLKLSLEIHC